jgi:hypothetical protein
MEVDKRRGKERGIGSEERGEDGWMEKRENGWKGLREYRIYIIFNIKYNPLYREDGASNNMKREKISFLLTVMNKRETVSRNLFL